MGVRYVLIHGANGTGAGFAALADQLRARGHEVVAPDLPIEDRTATFTDYAATVGAGDVIVGHSMGAITASIVAAREGARVAYVAGLLPRRLRSLGELLRTEAMICPGVSDALQRRDGLDFWTDPETFGLDPAFLRGQSVTPYFEPLEDPVPGLYVVCTRDRVVSPAYGRSVGMDVVELDCGHDAFRELPAAVADLLGA